MTLQTIFLDGIGLLGPGLTGWEQTREILLGNQPYIATPTLVPAAERLPAAERRRVGIPVKVAMACGLEAARHGNADVSDLATVFSSAEADCDNSHAILEALASDDRALSPTRFHNSVHNAPAGYWGIATRSMRPSTSLNAYDATFAAGLLEAATQSCSNGLPCMLVAYDTAFPAPLLQHRPIPDAMGIALVLNSVRTPSSLATLKLGLCEAPVTTLAQRELETLRSDIPVARALPLLALLAHRRDGTVIVDYLDHLQMGIEVCNLTRT